MDLVSPSECRIQGATDEDLRTYEENGTNFYAELRAGHRELASCAAYHWVDFNLPMAESGLYGENLIFEVLAIDAETNPNALAVYLYENEINDDRTSEHFSTTAADGVYSVSVSSISTDRGSAPDSYILGVRCQAAQVRFSVVVAHVPSSIERGDHVFATICPNSWIYFRHVATEAHFNLRVAVTKYQGSLSYIVRREPVPVRLVYPYATLNDEDHRSQMNLCDVEAADTVVWIGFRGGDSCASFYVDLEYFHGAVCSEEENAISVTSAESTSFSVVRLNLYQFPSASKVAFCRRVPDPPA